MLKRPALIVVLPLLLLLAQQQLLAHEISHLDSQTQQQDKHQAPHQHFCPQCAQSIGIDGALEIKPWNIDLFFQSFINETLLVSRCIDLLTQHFSARAPPVIL